MPRTSIDKCSIGLKFISHHFKKSIFHCPTYARCNEKPCNQCCCLGSLIGACSNEPPLIKKIKKYFQKMVKKYWKKNSFEDEPEEMGSKLASYLEEFCLFQSKKPMYSFPHVVDGESIVICLSILMHMFGVTRLVFRTVYKKHSESKKIGLSLLKKACQDPGVLKSKTPFYINFSKYFPQYVVPISSKYKKAVDLIEKTLKGVIKDLDGESCDSLKYILKNHMADQAKMTNIVAGGDNLLFDYPSGLPEWNNFEKNPKTVKFHEDLLKTWDQMWAKVGKKTPFVMEYKATIITTLLTERKDNLPQKAHTDFGDKIVQATVEETGVKPCIGFTPMHHDGSMLLVYVNTAEEGGIPDQYYLYIPFGVLIMLPGDTVHAGGFGFGDFLGNEIQNPFFTFHQNPRISFVFSPNKKSKKWLSKKQIELVNDSAYGPDMKIISKLNDNLLSSFGKYKKTRTKKTRANIGKSKEKSVPISARKTKVKMGKDTLGKK